MAPGLDAEQVERHLSQLEPIGWRLGLERMQALCARLGDPQRRYLTLHIVGTNGKTSVARMCEALLADAGVRAGASVSPHLRLWRERISVGGEVITEAAFARAAGPVIEAARAVEGVTQFEMATAIAFQALADAGVEAAAIEAGLGGRLDASNVLDSALTVLTTVGRDHTEWLGESEEEIAAEKLAVLCPGTALLLGPVNAGVRALARRIAAEREADLVEIEAETGATETVAMGRGEESGQAGELPALAGGYRRLDLEIARRATNFALEQLRPGEPGLHPDPRHAREVASRMRLPGRLEHIEGVPPIILDVAHNPEGAAALAAALPELAGSRPVIGLIAVLADKDSRGIAEALAPRLDAVICTEIPAKELQGAGRPGAATVPAAELARQFSQAGSRGRERGQAREGTAGSDSVGPGWAEAMADAGEGLGRARELARERKGLVLVSGSHYLVARVRDRLL